MAVQKHVGQRRTPADSSCPVVKGRRKSRSSPDREPTQQETSSGRLGGGFCSRSFVSSRLTTHEAAPRTGQAGAPPMSTAAAVVPFASERRWEAQERDTDPAPRAPAAPSKLSPETHRGVLLKPVSQEASSRASRSPSRFLFL